MSYECSLQGIVVGNEQKERTFQRLVGLCGNHSVVDLFEHELVFIPSHQTPIGPARNDDVVLRLQSKITNEKEISMKYRQWFLCMQGNSEPQRTRTVTVRPMSRVQLSGDIFRFMKSLGYSFSFDVVRKGYTFAYDKVLKITMTQLYKVITAKGYQKTHTVKGSLDGFFPIFSSAAIV
ncbi:hypothetical protein BDF20DRAFT_857606 [Mycotypha africana]|uniref:uncharacterized protein n=1 Tax=Mycotypha africana TaxID=64632 RepID=UPI002301AA0C|nr:uncharacterized protein BDF20DRAFT_857606 [Mycotypha africana]KAI8984025.1 hypothetical protein BDF20DRAFT_857606 [Mycotypha africana]